MARGAAVAVLGRGGVGVGALPLAPPPPPPGVSEYDDDKGEAFVLCAEAAVVRNDAVVFPPTLPPIHL